MSGCHFECDAGSATAPVATTTTSGVERRDGVGVGVETAADVDAPASALADPPTRQVDQLAPSRQRRGERDLAAELARTARRRVTRCPRAAATHAASSPAGPPPTTTTCRGEVAGVSVPSSSSRPTTGFVTHVTGRPSIRFP